MPNHVHLILVPPDETALSLALSGLHRRYARHINFRQGWRGFLWQGRFASFAMDEDYLLTCTRYVELNPVRARLVPGAGDWPWSSAPAHLGRANDALLRPGPHFARIGDWDAFLRAGLDPGQAGKIRQSARTGRPLGSAGFLASAERHLGRPLGRRKPGPKPKDDLVAQPRLL